MCFLSVRMSVQCNQGAGSVWGWFVWTGSEQGTDRGCRSLLLLLLSARQSRGGAGLWHVGCLRWRPGAGAAAHGWAAHSSHCCCLPPGTGAGAGWDRDTAEHCWVEEVRRATSKVSAAPRG